MNRKSSGISPEKHIKGCVAIRSMQKARIERFIFHSTIGGAMATTIQVSEETHKLLKRLRETYGAPSYDEVLQHMHRDIVRRESFAGALKHIPKRRLLEGLRDKSDRM